MAGSLATSASSISSEVRVGWRLTVTAGVSGIYIPKKLAVSMVRRTGLAQYDISLRNRDFFM